MTNLILYPKFSSCRDLVRVYVLENKICYKSISSDNRESIFIEESPSKGEQLTSGGYPHDNEWPRESISVICPQCDALIYTQTTTSITPTTLLIAVAEYFIEFSLFFIPLYLPPFQRLVHYCPKCQAVLGEVSELQ